MLLKMAQHRPVPSPYIKEEQHNDPVSRNFQFLHFALAVAVFLLICYYYLLSSGAYVRAIHDAFSRSPHDREKTTVVSWVTSATLHSASSVCEENARAVNPCASRAGGKEGSMGVPQSAGGHSSARRFPSLPEDRQACRKPDQVRTR
jgi:hypothetical protein